jgi:hypothetical protein
MLTREWLVNVIPSYSELQTHCAFLQISLHLPYGTTRVDKLNNNEYVVREISGTHDRFEMMEMCDEKGRPEKDADTNTE